MNKFMKTKSFSYNRVNATEAYIQGKAMTKFELYFFKTITKK